MKCPICNHKTILFDRLDFNKSCEEINDNYLKYSGILIDYYLCDFCNFCFAPEFIKWTKKEFEDKIYNEDYIFVDPEYKEIRSNRNAKLLIKLLEMSKNDINHLDYGGGNGKLSSLLNNNGFRSITYDPYAQSNKIVQKKFNLITAFEVFEHVNDVDQLFINLNNLLSNDGCVIFTTGLIDDHLITNQRLKNWWYASPRNGHISLFSIKSLEILASKYNFYFKSFLHLGIHILSKNTSLSFLRIDYQAEINYIFNKKVNSLFSYMERICSENDSIVLYGFGVVSKIIIELFPEKIKMIVDNDVEKQNMIYKSFIIQSPLNLKYCDFDILVITVLGREENIIYYLQHDLEIESKKISFLRLTKEVDFIENYKFAKELNSFYNNSQSLFFHYKRVVLFGFSLLSKILISLYKENILFIVDNNLKLQSNNFLGIEIKHPQYIKNQEYDLILITVLGREEIIQNDLILNYKVNKFFIEKFRISELTSISQSELQLRIKKHQKSLDINYSTIPYKLNKKIKKLHLIFFMGIGDYFYTTPLWIEIKKLFPNIELIAYVAKKTDLMNNSIVYDLIKENPLFKEVYYYEGKMGQTWEEYDFSDVKKYLIENEDNMICPVIFNHTNKDSIHRVIEVFKSFSINIKNIPLPHLDFSNNDSLKLSYISEYINSLNKKVIFLHMETRSSKYEYKNEEELILKLIEADFFIVYIKKNFNNHSFKKESFYNLDISLYNIFETINLIHSIKVKKYFIATNSLMYPISSAFEIPTLALYILRDSTQTRQTFYTNMHVLTIDKKSYDFLPRKYCTLINENEITITDGNIVNYSPSIIVKYFLEFFENSR